ncbi:MAG: M4 family metallopeptidase [Acidimicrobiia bacterium]
MRSAGCGVGAGARCAPNGAALGHDPVACIVPPDLLRRIVRIGSAQSREAALETLALDLTFRQERAVQTTLTRKPSARARAARAAAAPQGRPNRIVYDQKNEESTALKNVVRREGDRPVADGAVNEAYDGFGATYRLWWEIYRRDSIDGAGLPLIGLVHFGNAYDNAFWDGEGHMVFGDGDGEMFTRLTRSLDVIGHELAHGVTQYTAKLAYSGQSGALNESVSDVFGSLVKQYALGQTADQADWLIGADVVGPELAPALRSMKAPGTANKYDSQPADMEHYVVTTSDNGGVHTNSGIPNKAFEVCATTLGGTAWDRAGRIWYEALTGGAVKRTSTFRTFARATVAAAGRLYGATSAEADAVKAGWDTVKVKR